MDQETEEIEIVHADTDLGPLSGGTAGSRQARPDVPLLGDGIPPLTSPD